MCVCPSPAAPPPPPPPAALARRRTAGRSAVNLAGFSRGMCLETGLPERADLVVVENAAMNDARSAEALLLRLLRHYAPRMDAPPALLLLGMHRMNTATYDATGCLTNLSMAAMYGTPKNVSCCAPLEAVDFFLAANASS